MRIRHETLSTAFDLVYVGLATNLLVVASGLPLLVLALTTDVTRSWPLLALLAPLCAPGLCGVFAALAAYSTGRRTDVFATYARGWRASARRALPLGAAASAALVVLGVDARVAWGRPIGAVAIPILGSGMVLVVVTALLAFVVLAERPTVRLRDAGRACLYLAVRRWPLTLVSLTILVLLQTLFVIRPAVALGLAAAPLLYAVWANSRFTLNAALGPATVAR